MSSREADKKDGGGEELKNVAPSTCGATVHVDVIAVERAVERDADVTIRAVRQHERFEFLKIRSMRSASSAAHPELAQREREVMLVEMKGAAA